MNDVEIGVFVKALEVAMAARWLGILCMSCGCGLCRFTGVCGSLWWFGGVDGADDVSPFLVPPKKKKLKCYSVSGRSLGGP
jgi:hypothetical protein